MPFSLSTEDDVAQLRLENAELHARLHNQTQEVSSIKETNARLMAENARLKEKQQTFTFLLNNCLSTIHDGDVVPLDEGLPVEGQVSELRNDLYSTVIN